MFTLPGLCPIRLSIVSVLLPVYFQILLKLGIVVYRALDYNLPTSEDCQISHELEELIDFMTSEGKYALWWVMYSESGKTKIR